MSFLHPAVTTVALAAVDLVEELGLGVVNWQHHAKQIVQIGKPWVGKS